MSSPSIAKRIAELDLRLPSPLAPRGAYESVVVHGGVAYVSGQVCRDVEGEELIRGPATRLMAQSVFDKASTLCVLRALSVLEGAIGSLDRIDRAIFMRGFVAAADDFTELSRALDPASNLLCGIFGRRGEHARSAIGVRTLPSAGLMEIELIFALAN